MQYSYLIVDDNKTNIQETLRKFEEFPDYYCAGIAENKDDAINKILELQPQIVFLEISPKNKKSNLSLNIITELYRFIDNVPYFIALTASSKLAFEAIQAGVSDYLLAPLSQFDLRKSLLKFQKTNPAAANGTICIRSYGDYQFISLNDIVYLKADNNTTDFYLQNGRKLTAYKTLKHYETNLPFYFFRIHNSYIVNINFVSRINTGKSLCYLNNSDLSISFSKTFKDNVDTIIRKIAPEYL
ncbi:LytTR family DNA-binding domain-containing protein [Flavobacterium sp. DG1-102-2]|uniref:LytR/AlgR family response regulator transcription factor n=1 Tax=Flavobacterium sp. DG1-102-2 TaxID=3081663 RepID=UPI0029491A5F|nr:LytTR family DNA-binding domain-containing protein [Flavobacterium sp. DG1-102-2]MDV6168216.1 LytTR family DNA-binding domain-containing protein [Flavobacterium sp. DG1-102-2]